MNKLGNDDAGYARLLIKRRKLQLCTVWNGVCGNHSGIYDDYDGSEDNNKSM